MKRLPKAGFAMMLGVVGLVAALAVSVRPAAARPQYNKEFKALYGSKIEKVSCAICHPEKSKKVRNAYGKAMGAGLGMPNQKDPAKITEALKAAEAVKAPNGKTFGEMIEAGESPADAGG